MAALPPFYVFPLLFITVSLWIWLIDRSDSPRRAFACGYWFGFSFFAFGLCWIGNALLLDNTFLRWLYPVVFLACGVFFAFFFAVPAYLSWFFKTAVARYLAFAGLIVVFEWIRSFFLTGFPWNLWGSVLAFHTALLQPASVGGAYLLSLLVLLICGAPFLYLAAPNRKNLILSGSIIFILFGGTALWGGLRLQEESSAPSSTLIRIVQPSIPQSFKWDEGLLEQNLDTYLNFSRKAPTDGIKAVIWGETASPFPLDFDEAHNFKVRGIIPQEGYLITGQVRYHTRDSRRQASNSLLVFDNRGNPRAWYDKFHLVPFGEYIPLRRFLPDWLRPLANTVGTFTPGPGPKKITLPGLPDFGAAICYEAIFPGRILDSNNRPQWLINPANDGWYGNSAGPHQHLVAARIRAVEEGITVVRAANSGISAVISPFGTIIKQLGLNQADVLDVYLPQQLSLPTLYGQYGNFIILMICFILINRALFISRKYGKIKE